MSTATKGELIKVEQDDKGNPTPAVGVNTQAAVAVMVTTLFMLGTRRQLKTIIANQKIIFSAINELNTSAIGTRELLALITETKGTTQ